MTKTMLFAGLALIATSTAAQNRAAPYTVAETGRGYGGLQQAVDAIGDSEGTIVIRPGSFRDCAVQTAGDITFEAQIPGQSIFDGGVCEDKATLVLRGGGASVDGIIFQNVGVKDGNGAGIRLEKSDLAVTRSIFRNSEQGILTGDDESGSITIDQSTFSGLGRCDRGLSCAHSIYIGNYGSLSVTNSRFERGNGGHYVKSRAARIDVSDNAFDDSRGKETNYMIDLSNGATGKISGNVFVQGASKENYSAFITIAPEGKSHSSNGLSINDNDASIAPGVDRTTTFVANWTDDRIAIGANRLGRGLKPADRR
jgi:Right handed beta helix region